MLLKLAYAILVVLTSWEMHGIKGDTNEDTWVIPNAWGGDVPGWKLSATQDSDLLNSCPVCKANTEPEPISEEMIALMYYKKFILNLFNRKKLQFNMETAIYQRSILFSILPAQLDKLEQLNVPRDLDSVLMEIIAAVRIADTTTGCSADKNMGILALVLDIFKDLGELLRNSEIRFGLIVLTGFLLCWYLHRRYQFGIVRMVVIVILLFGYFITYLECNRKLEIEELVEFFNANDDQQNEPRWYSTVANIFWKQKDLSQIEKIKKSREFELRFCRPDHVLIMYANDLFLKQLEFLIEKFTSAVSKLTNNLSFPLNLLAPCLLLGMIMYVLKLTYKYILSPKAWGSLLHNSHNRPQQHNTLASSGVAALTEDRISGENLKVLLNAFCATKSVDSIMRPAVSGVEEVLEQIEAVSVHTSANSSKNSSLNTSDDQNLHTDNNNSTKSEEFFDKSKVTSK